MFFGTADDESDSEELELLGSVPRTLERRVAIV
jgi:hypothetical protein